MKAQRIDKVKKATELIDLVLKALSVCALLAGGIWAYFQFHIAGSQDWMTNLIVSAEVLPYDHDFRLVTVHVKSKNPRLVVNELIKGRDAFELHIRKVPDDLKEGVVMKEGDGALIATTDLLQENLQLLPGAEFDDTSVVVVRAGITIELTAKVEVDNGRKTRDGKSERDYVSASTVIRVEVSPPASK